MKRTSKIFIYCLFFVCISTALLSLGFLSTVSTNSGYYKIQGLDTSGDNHYIYIEFLNKIVRLKCNDTAYALANENANAYFFIEFKYSKLFSHLGLVVHIQYDEYLTETDLKT